MQDSSIQNPRIHAETGVEWSCFAEMIGCKIQLFKMQELRRNQVERSCFVGAGGCKIQAFNIQEFIPRPR